MNQNSQESFLLKRKILIVEDDPGLQNLILRTLKKDHYDVSAVSTGKEALASLKEDTAYLMLLDQKLPDMQGRDVIHQLNENDLKVPFIVMTGQGDERVAVEMMKLGAMEYLIKDMDFLEILPSIVMKCLKLIDSEEKITQIEMALKDSESRFRQIFEQTDAIAVQGYNEELDVIFWNKASELLYKYSQEEALGKKLYDLIIPENMKEEVKLLTQKWIKDSIPIPSSELTLLKADASYVQVFSNHILLKNINGKAELYCVDIDLTQQKKYLNELIESESKFRQITENMGDVFWLRSLDNSQMYYINKAYEQIWGLPCESIYERPQSFMDRIHPQDIEEVKRAISSLSEKGKFDIQYRIIMDDQSIKWIHSKTFPVIDQNGTITAYTGIATDITQRKKAEEQVKKLSQAIEQSPSIVMITDLNGKIEYINPKFSEITGYSSNEVLGKTPDFLNFDNDFNEEEIWNQIRLQKIWKGEFHNKKKNGEGYWELASVSPIFDENNQVINYIKVAEDITQRKNDEDEIKKQSELRQLLIEISSNYINLPLHNVEKSINLSLIKLAQFFDVDRAYIFDFNPENETASCVYHWCREGIDSQVMNLQNIRLAEEWMISFKKREILYIPDVVLDPYEETKQILLPQNVKSVISVPVINGDQLVAFIGFDAVRNYHIFSTDEQNLLSVFAQMLLNIRLRKSTEDFLNHEIEKNNALLNANPDLMFIFNADYKIVDCHPKTKNAMFLFDPLEFINKRFDDFLPEHICKKTKECIDNVLKNRQMEYSSYSLNINGKELFFEARYVLCHENEVLAIVRNVTDVTLAEIENNKMQKQLIQSQKMESIGRLAGGVAHDFNNMLSVILSNVEMELLNLNSHDILFHRFQEIKKAAVRSADLTKQLLLFARKQEVVAKVIDLNEALSNTLNMLKRLITEDISLIWTPGEHIFPIKIDPTQLDQLLANLIVNARDAISSEGKIIIKTENKVLDKDYCKMFPEIIPGEYVMIEVSDNGCGIDSESLSHIFEPFYTTKEIGRGTGLGLATVYGVVKQNNGYIYVTSVLSQGTTFSIYFPHYVVAENQFTEYEEDHLIASGNENILLVEDEVMILNVTTAILKKLGYKVFAFSDPLEALKVIQNSSEKIDLLITDVIMPNMNGTELVNRIHAIDADIRIMYISGYTANMIDQQTINGKKFKFLHKPFSMHELAGKVREALN